MKVDISPNFPPSSSWTIEAPFGSGSLGGGISACRRSSRMIIGSPLVGGATGRRWYPASGRGNGPRPSWSADLVLADLFLGLGTQPLQGRAQESRDVHLRTADPGSDLRLREILDEAQPQHLTLTRIEARQHGLQGQAILDQFVAGVDVPHP